MEIAEKGNNGEEGAWASSVQVTWRSLSLSVQLGKKENQIEKRILDDVSGHANPGELLAIMGPSGAGKTTLLNCLASRAQPTSGTILFNGKPIKPVHRRRIAYVHQQEMLLALLTPREHLLLQSSLRMPRDVSASERTKRVDASISLFGLHKCQHRLIGDAYGGISKNEKRRLAFATEVLSQPAVLLADEPTTGLDSAMAEVVVKYMKALANEGPAGAPVTVMATIHQPSSDVFRLFSQLCFVIDGKVGYHGSASDVEAHFASIGFPLPDHTSPAEFIMTLCVDPGNPTGAAERRGQVCKAWAQSEVVGAQVDTPQTPGDTPDEMVGRVGASWFKQFTSLTRREFLMKMRSPHELKAVLLRCVFLGLLFGLTFFQVDKDQDAVFSLNGALFFTMIMATMNHAMGTAMGIPERVPTLIREHRSGAYSVAAIYVSKALADIPFDAFICVLWSTLLFWMIGFRDDFVIFLQVTLVLYMMVLVGVALGYFGGYTSSVGALALMLCIVNLMPQMLFGGLFINLNSVPPGFRWLKEISLFRHGYQALMLLQWKNYGSIDCSSSGSNSCRYPDGKAVLEYYGVDENANHMVSVGYLVIFLFVYHPLAILSLHLRARPKRFEGAAPEDDTKGLMPAGPANDTEQAKTAGRDEVQLTLEWRELAVNAQQKDTKGKSKASILSGCSGSVKPGELVAFMGPSGSGKSTLLKALAHIGELPLAEGRVLLNGSSWTESLRPHVAFMHQEETFFGGLTAAEHLMFQSRLRSGNNAPSEQLRRVNELIAELGLEKCRNTLIGQIGSGISGGERKRLAFSAEMLTDPALVIVDEPTSGLDSSMARSVMRLLRRFANGQRGAQAGTPKAVCVSIHQPSSEVFALFDKLVLLVDGRTVYYGLANNLLTHFESVGLVCPHDVSVSDFAMRCVAVDAGEQADREKAAANVQTLLGAVKALEAPQEDGKLDARGKTLGVSWTTQCITLLRREMLIRRRSKLLFKAAVARTVLMSLFMGLLYFRIDHNQFAVQSIMGALNMLMMNTFMTHGFGLTQEVPIAFRTAYRENKLGQYSLGAWFWSKTVSDFPLDMALSALGTTVFFWLTLFRNDVVSWLHMVLVSCATASVANGWGYLCAVIGQRVEVSFAVFLLTVFAFIVFSGFVITSSDVPVYFKWIEVISPIKYLYSQYVIAVWDGHGRLDDCPNGRCPFPDGDSVLEFFGIKPSHSIVNGLVLPAYIVFTRLISWALLALRERR